MKFKGNLGICVTMAVGAWVAASLSLLPLAKGELVLESDRYPEQSEQEDDTVYVERGRRAAPAYDFGYEDHETSIEEDESDYSRRSGPSSYRAGRGHEEYSRQRQGQAINLPGRLPHGGNTSIIQVQPQVQAQSGASAGSSLSPVDENVDHFSNSQMLKRQRVSVERKNEDLLQERLETLRLRDEKRRTDELLTATAAAAAASVSVSTSREDVVVGSAHTDRVIVTSASVTRHDDDRHEEGAVFSISPRGGVANMTGMEFYEVSPRYSLGLGIGIGASSVISFEAGYIYSEYGVELAETNPFAIYQRRRAQAFGGQASFESVALKQNVFDAGLKLHLLGHRSKFRPFVGGGGAYGKSYVNYDERILGAMDPASLSRYGRDLEIDSFLGSLSTGFDVQVAKNVSITAMFKYYAVLSSRESSQFNNAALYGGPQQAGQPNGAWGGQPALGPQFSNPATWGPDATESDKATAAGSFSQSNFYTILGGVTFSF